MVFEIRVYHGRIAVFHYHEPLVIDNMLFLIIELHSLHVYWKY